MNAISAIQHAKAAYKADRFPCIEITSVFGEFYLCDSDGNLFSDRSHAGKDIAMTVRSRILDRAAKAHWATAKKG